MNSKHKFYLFTAAKALEDACQYDVQCDSLAGIAEVPSPGAALCLGGTCACAYDARAVGNPPRCWRRKRPGQECNRDEVRLKNISTINENYFNLIPST